MKARWADEWDGHAHDTLAASWLTPRVETWASIPSTNDRAAELVREEAAPWTIVVADEQTAGRGRRGAEWHSPAGCGLWMSVVLAHGLAPEGLPLVVGTACAEAIRSRAPEIAVGIKWPNDLLVGGRKVGGILCERIDDSVVAGIGINVSTPPGGFPAEVRSRATSLEVSGPRELSRSDLAGSIVAALRLRLTRSDPFGEVYDDLVAADALRGRRIRTEQAGAGTARGIDTSGALLLERDDGSRVRVISGSVRFADAPARPVP